MSELSWALAASTEYQVAAARLHPKFRGQIARKVQDLMADPRPGGSRTALTGYNDLFRLRAGDFRIIYTYNTEVVHLIRLDRRDEKTYDKLDDHDHKLLAQFKKPDRAASVQYRDASWAQVSTGYSGPPANLVEPLPPPISEKILIELGVEQRHWTTLQALRSVDELLECEAIPHEVLEAVLERLCPRKKPAAADAAKPIVTLVDLVDEKAAIATGPIDSAQNKNRASGPADVKKVSGPVRPLYLNPLTRHSPPVLFPGNTESGIRREAKYTAKMDGRVQLLHGKDEPALLTTDTHKELVGLVNEVKRFGGGKGGGKFLINEYRHILVPPTENSKDVLFAGVYTRDLEFKLAGNVVLSPVAPASIRCGDVWPGPHAGLKYRLTAGAQDVRYEVVDGGEERCVFLSDFFSPDDLRPFLAKLRSIKPKGGPFYVNEAREMFAPLKNGEQTEYIYIGPLKDQPWFPEPVWQ